MFQGRTRYAADAAPHSETRRHDVYFALGRGDCCRFVALQIQGRRLVDPFWSREAVPHHLPALTAAALLTFDLCCHCYVRAFDSHTPVVRPLKTLVHEHWAGAEEFR